VFALGRGRQGKAGRVVDELEFNEKEYLFDFTQQEKNFGASQSKKTFLDFRAFYQNSLLASSCSFRFF